MPDTDGLISGARTMSTHHKDQLIDAFMHYCTPEIRKHLMRECPDAYNAYCGRDVVRVVHTSDGREVQP